MARVSMIWSPIIGATLFNNVEAAVGLASPNQRHDVLLIQYLLREVAKDNAIAGAYTPPRVTGTVGQDTIDAIRAYQDAATAAGDFLSTDGRIDPVPGNTAFGSNSFREYTILSLNLRFGFLRPDDLQALGQAGDIPHDLTNIRTSFIGIDP